MKKIPFIFRLTGLEQYYNQTKFMDKEVRVMKGRSLKKKLILMWSKGDQKYNKGAAIFMIAERWKQPKGPSMGEWMNKMWYDHIVAYWP